jgi:hypothetical protein
MSKQRTESLDTSEEQIWQAQERTLCALRDHIGTAAAGDLVRVDDTAIFEALTQPPEPALPADFAAVVAAASASLQARRRQVHLFRRAVFGGLVLTYAVVGVIGLLMADGAGLKAIEEPAFRGLYDSPWFAAALVAAILVAALGRRDTTAMLRNQ